MINMLSVSVDNTEGAEPVAQLAYTFPAGPSSVTITNTSDATVIVGTGDAFTDNGSNGVGIPAGATITFPGFVGGGSTPLYVWVDAAGTATLNIFTSTPG